MAAIQTTKNLRTSYWQKGWVHLRGVFGKEEMEALRKVCDGLDMGACHYPEAAVRTDLDGNAVRDRLDPAPEAMVASFVNDSRLLTPLADIFGSKPIAKPPFPLKSKLIFKPPGTNGYGLHQDYPGWAWTGIPAASIASVQICIDAADESNGPLIFYPGLHDNILPAPPEEPLDVSHHVVEGMESYAMHTQAGDVLIFHSLTPHESGPNLSEDRSRRAFYIVYNESQHGFHYDRYYQDRDKFLK